MIMWGRGGRGWLLINVLIANLIWTSLHASDKGQINPNIAKGTTDPRVEFISHDITQILIKFQFQNLD